MREHRAPPAHKRSQHVTSAQHTPTSGYKHKRVATMCRAGFRTAAGRRKRYDTHTGHRGGGPRTKLLINNGSHRFSPPESAKRSGSKPNLRRATGRGSFVGLRRFFFGCFVWFLSLFCFDCFCVYFVRDGLKRSKRGAKLAWLARAAVVVYFYFSFFFYNTWLAKMLGGSVVCPVVLSIIKKNEQFDEALW